ncbi:MAG TPA: hypothetical protein DDZ83_17235 [Nitrospinae bacterium]|nr:hypothetical protein [Nitrospinota bacterium]
MRFGIKPHQGGGNWNEVVVETKLAEELGFDSVFFGEHHGVDWPQFSSPMLVLAALAGCTSRIRLGTSVLLFPLHSLMGVAEDAALLDVVSEGRLILGLGAGYLESEFDAFGVKKSERAARLEEGIPLLRSLWAGKEVTHESARLKLDRFRLNPLPRQDGGPEIWYGGWEKTPVQRAARLADAYFPGPSGNREKLRICYRIYLEALEEGKGEPSCRPLMRDVVLVRDAAERRRAEESLVRLFKEGYSAFGHQNVNMDTFQEELRRGDRCFLGEAEEVIDQIHSYREEFGIDYLVIRVQNEMTQGERGREMIKEFARKVMPEFV